MSRPADFYTKVPHRVMPRGERQTEYAPPLSDGEIFRPEPKPIPKKDALADFVLGMVATNDCLSKMDSNTNPNFIGREEEVNSVLESLLKKRMRNCVLIGDAGVGKTEIARKAISMVKDEVFLKLDTASLASGCTLMGQFEKKIIEILEPISHWNQSHSKKVSLFVDEIHTLWNLGANSSTGSVSAGNILKPYLSDGLITIIGATTPKEYESSIKGDRALMRRVTPIFIAQMPNEAVLGVLRAFCGNELSEQMIAKVLEASSKINYLSNPDCSIEIADRLMAKALRKRKIPDDQDLEEVMKSMLAL